MEVQKINYMPVRNLNLQPAGRKYKFYSIPAKGFSADTFEYQNRQSLPQVNFTGTNALQRLIIKYLKNRSYENSMLGSRRPYLSIDPELEPMLKRFEIKVGKNESIEAFDINPKNAIEKELRNKKSKLILCKINIKENTPAVFYTNIMFYDNFNKTLPVGMNLSTEVLLDINKLNLKFVKEDSFYVNYKVDEFDFNTKEIIVYEYEVEMGI